MGFPSKGCSIGLRPDASGSKSYAHVWNQLNGLKGIGSGVVADQCLPLSTGASIPKCRLRSNNLCRKRSQFARIQSSRNENEVGPSNLGGPGDRDVAGTTSVDDLWTYVIDSERPSSLVDFPYLEKDTSQESEGALRWEVIGIVSFGPDLPRLPVLSYSFTTTMVFSQWFRSCQKVKSRNTLVCRCAGRVLTVRVFPGHLPSLSCRCVSCILVSKCLLFRMYSSKDYRESATSS